MSDELTGPAKVLDALVDTVTDAFIAADGPKANALKRLRGYLMHVQGSDEFREAGAMLQALHDRPKVPGFGGYGADIDRAIRAAMKELEG